MRDSYRDVETSLRARVEVEDVSEEHGQLSVRIGRQSRPDALGVLKDMGFKMYVFCCGVDWPDQERFEVLDQVYSLDRRQRVTLRCDVPRAEPRLPTATRVYAGADWHERETHELFGIVFAGHPRLARLLLPDWFEGYPMRKDYVLAARVEKPWPGESFKPE
jgi:NADH-quinone oxidoreductase subunit C